MALQTHTFLECCHTAKWRSAQERQTRSTMREIRKKREIASVHTGVGGSVCSPSPAPRSDRQGYEEDTQVAHRYTDRRPPSLVTAAVKEKQLLLRVFDVLGSDAVGTRSVQTPCRMMAVSLSVPKRPLHVGAEASGAVIPFRVKKKKKIST